MRSSPPSVKQSPYSQLMRILGFFQQVSVDSCRREATSCLHFTSSTGKTVSLWHGSELHDRSGLTSCNGSLDCYWIWFMQVSLSIFLTTNLTKVVHSAMGDTRFCQGPGQSKWWITKSLVLLLFLFLMQRTGGRKPVQYDVQVPVCNQGRCTSCSGKDGSRDRAILLFSFFIFSFLFFSFLIFIFRLGEGGSG